MGGDEIRYKLVTNIEPSFSRTTRKRCFRVGGRRGNRLDELPLKTVQLVPPGDKCWTHAQVYQVAISPTMRERWPKQPANFYVVCKNYASIQSYLEKRYGKIAQNHMGVAHLAITEAMAAVSTRPRARKAGKHAEDVAKRVVRVVGVGNAEDYKISVRDDLVFALDALKGGRSTLEVSIKRAANRIAGRLKRVGDHLLDPSLQTPFPEVMRKK